MNLREEIKPYTDQYGMVHPKAGSNSGNGLRYFGDFIACLAARIEVERAEDSITLRNIYDVVKVQPGLLRRHPTAFRRDQEGPDDYVGFLYACWVLDTNVATEILNYGLKNKYSFGEMLQSYIDSGKADHVWAWKILKFLFGWVKVRFNYNNINPDKITQSSWLGRQGQLVAHIYWSANQTPPLFYRVWWALSIGFFSVKPNDPDSAVLSRHLVCVMAGRSWICRVATHLWRKRFIKTWPGGMNQVFTKYFGQAHPLSRGWPLTAPEGLLEARYGS
jgi:hypothetical protein